MNKHLIDQVVEKMKSISSVEPLVVRAPGRINLIGEHTDYNNGFVLPAAVDLSIYFAITKSGSNKCNVYSLDLDESFDFEIDKELVPQSVTWANYIIGVISELKKLDASLEGFNLVFGGDVPQGSGMSSSAALECGLCLGMNELFDLGLDREQMAKVSQAAEHNYVGVKCGIMDQFASLMGKENEVILLDCKSLDYSLKSLNLNENKLLLLNSNVKHSHTSSGYNERREQTEEGVAIVAKHHPEVESMREVTMEMLEEVKEE
ncbi:MAG: galactokinase family protein, partial [Bacteroidota bacterium]